MLLQLLQLGAGESQRVGHVGLLRGENDRSPTLWYHLQRWWLGSGMVEHRSCGSIWNHPALLDFAAKG